MDTTPYTSVTVLIACAAPDQRTHIEVFRHGPQEDLEAAIILQPKGNPISHDTRLFATDVQLKLLFGDGRSVTLEKTTFQETHDIFDIFINDRLTHTCTYRHVQEGVIVHIFKEEERIKIAQAGESVCILTIKDDEDTSEKTDLPALTKKYKPTRLR